MDALGLIETRGLLPAIECADTMLKTAQVELMGKTLVGGGLVTIIITGDVGAVKAAVDAGVSAVEKFGDLSLVSQHIIPRPYHETHSLVTQPAKSAKEPDTIPLPRQEATNFSPAVAASSSVDQPLPNQGPEPAACDPVKALQSNTKPVQITLQELCKASVDAAVGKFGLERGVNALRPFSVERLRNLAREYKELGIAGRTISKANKNLLLQEIRGYYTRVKER